MIFFPEGFFDSFVIGDGKCVFLDKYVVCSVGVKEFCDEVGHALALAWHNCDNSPVCMSLCGFNISEVGNKVHAFFCYECVSVAVFKACDVVLVYLGGNDQCVSSEFV